MPKYNLPKLALIGYTCLMIASAGYYGYYKPKEDSIIWGWVIFFLLGIVSLSYKNYMHYRQTQDKRILGDILVVLSIFYIPLIPLPNGLSILLMMAVCTTLSMVLVNAMFHPWK